MTDPGQDSVLNAPPARYGDSAADLEALRKLVEQRCPMARFSGYTKTGAETGEYRFLLSPMNDPRRSRSVYIRAPTTPSGRLRDGLGLWRFRRAPTSDALTEWRRATRIDTVVDWICREAKLAHTRGR